MAIRPPSHGMYLSEREREAVRRAVLPFQRPVTWRSVLQAGLTFALLLTLLTAMHLLVSYSFWLTLPLALPTAGLVVRLFIIQHDCGHGAYFRNRRANDMLARACSLFTLTPYANWRRQHAGHHAIWNNLDRRESGVDIYSSCLTLWEYRALPRRRRIMYRLVRHPLVALLVLPPLVFIALYRVPFDTPRNWRRERRSVWLTNLGVGTTLTLATLALGAGPMLAVHLPVMATAAIAGVWLFSVQHRFEGSQWARAAQWDQVSASLGGSSFLRLPRVLEWFTGSIGYHHIHHLAPRVPNYFLRACHARVSTIVPVPAVGMREALRAWRWALWDEAEQRMVGWPRRRRAFSK